MDFVGSLLDADLRDVRWRYGGQYADRYPVPPVEHAIGAYDGGGSFHHDRQYFDTRFVGQREGSGLESVNLTVFRSGSFRKYGDRYAASEPHLSLVDQLFHGFGRAPSVDAYVPVDGEELAEKRQFEDFPLRYPPEVEGQEIEGGNVGHGSVVDDDHIGFMRVDVLTPDDAMTPQGGDKKEDPDQSTRQFMHDAA